MDIGSLHKRLSIQQRDDSIDSSGAPIPDWTTLITVWGDITPLSGRELLAAQQVQADISHNVTLRWTGRATPLDSSMRIEYTDAQSRVRHFDIQAIINTDERNRVIILSCIEREGED